MMNTVIEQQITAPNADYCMEMSFSSKNAVSNAALNCWKLIQFNFLLMTWYATHMALSGFTVSY